MKAEEFEELYKKDIILHIFHEIKFEAKCPVNILFGAKYYSIVLTETATRDVLDTAKIINRMVRQYGYLPSWGTEYSEAADKKFRVVRIDE